MGRIRGKVEESCFFFFKGKKVQFSRNVKEKTMVVDHILHYLKECWQRFRKTFQNTFFFIPNLNIYIQQYSSLRFSSRPFIGFDDFLLRRSIRRNRSQRLILSSSIERERESNSYLYPITELSEK